MTNTKLLGKYVRKHGSRRILFSFISLVIGLVAGFCMARLFEFATLPNFDCRLNIQNQSISTNVSYDSEEVTTELSAHAHTFENSSMAEKLYNEIRVLCWIMTKPGNHKTRALAVKRTWGQRCNKLIFMSTAEDEELDAVALNVTEGRQYLWGKTKAAFKYIYANHMDDADWFLKADDDTYVILENLRLMLYSYTPETPIYFGCKFKVAVKQGYMSGGAGYVLSKEAVNRFVTKAIPHPKLCKAANTGAEDAEIGKCLQKVKVIAGDSRDSEGRARFMPLSAENHFFGKVDKKYWYWRYIYYKNDLGMNCCSDNAISFHYVKPEKMYVFDYLIYHLRPYGIAKTAEVLPKKFTLEEILTSLVSSRINSSNEVKSNITK